MNMTRAWKPVVALWQSSAAILFVAGLLSLTVSAKANLVANGGFEQTTLTNTNYFNQFSPGFAPSGGNGNSGASNVADWTVNCAGTQFYSGLCGPGDPLLFLVVPNTSPTEFSPGNALYGPGPNPGSTAIPVSPNGGNFIAEDGNTFLNTSFSQQISGLTPGNNYVVSFFQAASQQQGQQGPTTEIWQVGLGSQTQDSAVMNNPANSFTPWENQSLTFTATSASEALTFMAVGTGAPPVALLDGVSLDAATPEPAYLAITGLGLLGIFAVRRLRSRRAQ